MIKIGILVLSFITAISCNNNCERPRDYDVEITYMNGDKDSVRMTSYSCYGDPPYLDGGLYL
jgi:hypothetical protein